MLRDVKYSYLESCVVQARATVVFVQQAGLLDASAVSEYFRVRGWTSFHSSLPNGTGGVLTLVSHELQRTYQFVPHIICPGHIMAITSTRVCSCSLVNVYMSAYGYAARKPQYGLLHNWLKASHRGFIIFGGDFNRSEGSQARWIYARNEWAPADTRENESFNESFLQPFSLARVQTSILSFTHRSGKYSAALDGFYVQHDPAWHALYKWKVSSVTSSLACPSDHKPLLLSTCPLHRADRFVLRPWVVKDPLFHATFVSVMNEQCQAAQGHPYALPPNSCLGGRRGLVCSTP